jgi:hypothetical protein
VRWRTWAAIVVLVVLVVFFSSLLEARASASTGTSTWSWHTTYMTWYGPGFYGNRMACGGTLTRKTIGVAAHADIPCGTQIELRYRDRKSGRHHRYAYVVDHCGCAAGSALDATARLAIHLTGHPPHSMKHVHYRFFREVW